MSFLWLLEGMRTPFLDKLMQFITYFGQEIIIIAVICALYWCADKRFAYLLGFTYFVAGLGVQVLKITFRVPRPWILDPEFHAVESAVGHATGYSFPSGHTQGATALFYPMALKNRHIGWKAFYILLFVLVGFSRMYLGCHTPKDVLVSMMLTIVTATVLWYFQELLLNDNRYLKQIAGILIILSLAAAGYAWTLKSSGIIETKYAMDCCKSAGAGLGFAVGWYMERRKLNFNEKAGSHKAKALRLIVGLLLTVMIKEGMPLIIGTSVLAKMAEYFILVLWVLVIYPYLFNEVSEKR